MYARVIAWHTWIYYYNPKRNNKMLKIKVHRDDDGAILILTNDGNEILCFPADLNNFEPPELDEAEAIMNGDGLNMGPVEPVTVFRIENKNNGKGMYNCEPYPGLGECPYYDNSKNRALHPSPWSDSKLGRQMAARSLINPDPLWALVNGTPLTEDAENWRYGFASAEQARMWLHDDKIIKWLAEHDFVVTEFKVKPFNAMVGNTQVMFIHAPGSKKHHDIKSFFNI